MQLMLPAQVLGPTQEILQPTNLVNLYFETP
jgi:hypothetical protein